MDEGEKIVTEHFPVEKLPEELRHGLESGRMVRVTIEPEASPTAPQRSLRSFVGAAPGLYVSPEDAVAFVRSLRDDSDR